ncbi:MAG: hypothetical protein KC620_17965 [Myxococcales bacterium]|nr:hypothetical protein [Myxococcales bacterium]
MHALPRSIEGVVHVELLRGAKAADAPPTLLVEVPHGADERAHYDALRTRLVGTLPDDLHVFFHLNTDVGAWAYGRAVAEAVVAAEPTRAALVLRCLIPRTFIDCNRPADFTGDTDLDKGGVTAGIPAYVRDPADRALLLDLHRRYVRVVEQAFAAVCGQGGLALLPHTYGPTTLGIARVDEDIVDLLRWAHEPERVDTWPMRAEIDLLTRDAEGKDWSPRGLEALLMQRFRAAGFDPRANDTYNLHPATLGHTWSVRYPKQVLCLEVRRDLLVPKWRPFEPMRADAARVARVVEVLAPALLRR